MQATNAPEAEPIIRKHYRDGFGITERRYALINEITNPL